MDTNYTIKDLADLAGVSIGTVDRVLHNRGRVSETALRKVSHAIAQLNYRPNPIARTLKKAASHKIGILLPNPDLDTYWQSCKKGVEEVLHEFMAFNVRADIRYFNPFKPKSFLAVAQNLLKGGCSTFYFVPLFQKESSSIIQKCKEAGILVGSFNSFAAENVSLFVGQDLYLSGRTAAKMVHMCKKDISKIIVVHIDENYGNAVHMQEKERGFTSYFKEYAAHTVLHTLTVTSSELETSFTSFFKTHPDTEAIFISTSKAHEVAKTMSKMGKKDVLVAGYDLLKENITHLKRGEIDFLIHQKPKMQASLGLRYLVEHSLFNKTLPETYLLPIGVVNSENVESYLE